MKQLQLKQIYYSYDGEKQVLKNVNLDIFEGELAPLVLAEVEFTTEAEAKAFVPPEWFGEDVTYSNTYHNSVLSARSLK